MVLQLSGGVEALTCARPKEGELPTIASLAAGAAHAVVAQRLRQLFCSMWKDADLDVGPAVGALLGTAVDLLVRFDVFKAYPFRLCYLCSQVTVFNSCAPRLIFVLVDIRRFCLGVSALAAWHFSRWSL